MKKKKIIRYSIKAIIVVLLVTVFAIINNKINENNEKKEKSGYKYSIDKMNYNDETSELEIKGWCIKDGVKCDSLESRKDFKIFLAENGDLDKLIEIPVTSSARLDVKERYSQDGIDYTFCGFSGVLKIEPTIKEKRYRILIQYDSLVEKYFFTARYFNKGELATELEQFDY